MASWSANKTRLFLDKQIRIKTSTNKMQIFVNRVHANSTYVQADIPGNCSGTIFKKCLKQYCTKRHLYHRDRTFFACKTESIFIHCCLFSDKIIAPLFRFQLIRSLNETMQCINATSYLSKYGTHFLCKIRFG